MTEKYNVAGNRKKDQLKKGRVAAGGPSGGEI